MPQRTNQFQKVVYLLRKHLAGDSATVEESTMLVDSATGEEREVDVTIRGMVGGEDVLICVEVVSWQRRAGVPWVESMIAKHRDLPTNKLILASRSGFTKGALRKAEANHVVTLVLDQTTDVQIANLSQRLLWTSVTFHIKRVQVKVENPALDEDHDSEENPLICLQDGTPVKLLDAYVEEMIAHPDVGKAATLQVRDEHTHATITSEPANLPDGRELFLKVETPDGVKLNRLLAVNVVSEIEATQHPFRFEGGTIGGAKVLWGSVKVRQKDGLLVISSSEEGTAGTLTVGGAEEKLDVGTEDE